MSQVTIYIDEEIEQRMKLAAQSANLSKSKWIAKLIQEKVANEWPESIINLAGSWEDFPTIDSLRDSISTDIERESI